MGAIDYLSRQGLKADVAGERLRVWPASRLTDELRDWIKSHRNQLIDEAANTVSETKVTMWVVTVGSNTFPMIRPGGMNEAEALEAARARWPNAVVSLPKNPSRNTTAIKSEAQNDV